MFQLCNKVPNIIKYWFILAISVAGIAFTSFLLVQQNIRQSANDPQIQIAEDAATALAEGRDPKTIIKDNQIDISRSLSPFIIVYNDKGQPIQSTGDISGKIPAPPVGVFDYVRKNGTNKFTWEPKQGLRIAAVVYQGERKDIFILAGRSLREIEKRENMLLNITYAGIGLTLSSTFFTAFLLRKSNQG